MSDRKGFSTPDKKIFVLCFDGTGNKFEGTDSDSNILKIYRLLDRNQPNLLAYYQPGIGTYADTASFDHTSYVARFKSWYTKQKDAAVGTNLAQHVMAGYRFLQRYYTPEDDIYIFGFSRGAYTARFLAEMLDHVGLLSAGNEELQRFAWKCFSKWQTRRSGDTEKEKDEEYKIYTFMKNFRETFSRPVRRIRFLGLFDTVNSVPRFENAWMQRTKFPYTCQSSAKVIRHAVSINERRARFRQDLVSEKKGKRSDDEKHPMHRFQSDFGRGEVKFNVNEPTNGLRSGSPRRTPSQAPSSSDINTADAIQASRGRTDSLLDISGHQFEASGQSDYLNASSRPQGRRQSSFARPIMTSSMEDMHDRANAQQRKHISRRFSGNRKDQDIVECWFPGNHSDIGGGWPKRSGEKWMMSHAPLVWMVHEAQKAGLKFDPYRMADLNCHPDVLDEYGETKAGGQEEHFHDALNLSSTKGFIHDCLTFGKGLPATSVLSWKIMERLPFRRMDLQEDGRWRPIRWPLPMGEVRDIPADAKIHVSAIRRMETDESYRPGNLILLGTGGRGVKTAPKEEGTGEWKVVANEGNPVSEMYMKIHVKREQSEKD